MDDTLSRLKKKCSITLTAYLELAKEGCERLCQRSEVPLGEDMRNEILAHRRRELHAHSDYTKARSKLWEFLTRT